MLQPGTRIVVAQMETVPGNIGENISRMQEILFTARRNGADIVVFPELCTSGYVLGDRWEHDAFIEEIEAGNETIRAASQGLIVVWGSVVADWQRIGQDGRVRKYNAALIAQNGHWCPNTWGNSWVPKTNLPKYRVFDDARHFFPAGLLAAELGTTLDEFLVPFHVWINGTLVSLALTVCEDLWEDEYGDKVSQIYKKHNADFIIDISCSPWTYGKWHAREAMLKKRVQDAGVPILYVNAVSLENNTKNLILIDGDSCLIDKDGNFRWRGVQHREQIHMLDLDDLGEPLKERGYAGVKEIHSALIAGMKTFYAPFKRVVIGLSGGIDSMLAAALLVEALGPEKILAINMPTEFNSATTKNLAEEGARNLGIEYRVVPIQGLYEEHRRMLAQAGYPNPKGLTLENVQARIRGASVLAAIAQEEGGAFTCNGNKTEVALNYFTLYGDGAGAAAFLADLWKGQVYELARYINRRAGRELIPQGVIDVVPSAELSVDQAVDEGKGDPIFFPYHDNLLRAFTELRWDPTTVLEYLSKSTADLETALECAAGTIARYFPNREALIQNLEWAWRQYNTEFKRGQTPPVFLTSRRAFGFDRRDTIAAAYLTDRYRVLKQQYLALESLD